MMTWRWLCKGLLFFLSIAFLHHLTAPAVFSQADDVQRITVQELKAKMDKGEGLVVVDVRTGKDYEGSKIKIKGSYIEKADGTAFLKLTDCKIAEEKDKEKENKK